MHYNSYSFLTVLVLVSFYDTKTSKERTNLTYNEKGKRYSMSSWLIQPARTFTLTSFVFTL